MVVLHGQSSRSNMWPCRIELSKQLTPTPPLHWVILTGLGKKIRFTWLSLVLLHDSGGLLVPIIIRFSSVVTPYLFHICFWKYPFSYLFPVFLYSFLFPHKNMKTNVALVSSVRFRSVFIPTMTDPHLHSRLPWLVMALHTKKIRLPDTVQGKLAYHW
jgi:hypothetical protein